MFNAHILLQGDMKFLWQFFLYKRTNMMRSLWLENRNAIENAQMSKQLK